MIVIPLVKPSSPYRSGKEAFLAGQPESVNPFAADPDRRNWGYGYQHAAMEDLLSKTPIPDQSLIAECETLIPKGAYWCGHELNRGLHFYREACRKGDATDIKNSERSLRRGLVHARLEASGLPVIR